MFKPKADEDTGDRLILSVTNHASMLAGALSRWHTRAARSSSGKRSGDFAAVRSAASPPAHLASHFQEFDRHRAVSTVIDLNGGRGAAT